MKAIRVHAYGGPEAMVYEDVPSPEPGPGQIRVRQTAIGVNFIDIYFRSGAYKAPSLPFTLGKEGAGVVDALGEGVTDFRVGERVAYAGATGTYAEEVVVDSKGVVHVPASISDETAAAMMLKGLTAQYLLRRTYRVQPGDTILFHAAAGGVGLIATQWAKHLGATVIGTVGSQEKAELAREHGCDHVILYRNEDFAARVKEITGGKGVPVVYDGVGKATFPASLDCLSPSASSRASARPPAPSRRSTSASSPPRARSTPPARPCSPTSPPARASTPTPPSCSRWWPAAR